jgi:AcrR family transcriptional regulator
MTRIANANGRPYRSELRKQQAEETRARILDATVQVMARGIASLSIPDVAREAGVSVPTVYRHFRTKDALLAAVYPHVVRREGLDRLAPPATLDELRDGVRSYFTHLDSLDDLARAAMASPTAEDLRRLSMEKRLALFRVIPESVVPALSEADRDRIARLLVALTASAAQRLWLGQFGATVEEAADDIDWVIRAAIAAATPRQRR